MTMIVERLIKNFTAKVKDVTILDEKDFFTCYLPLDKESVVGIILTINIGVYSQLVFHPPTENVLERKPIMKIRIPKCRESIELGKGNHLVSGTLYFNLTERGNIIYPKFVDISVDEIKQI